MSDQEKSKSPRDWGGDEPVALPAPPPGEYSGRYSGLGTPPGPSPSPSELKESELAPARTTEPGPTPVTPFPEPEEPERTPEPEDEEEPDDRGSRAASSQPLRTGASSSPAGELYSEASFDQEEDEPFDLLGTEKLGIVGGKGVGKSFLFQGMVYRTYSKTHAGAVSFYVDKTELYYALERKDKAQKLILSEFGKNYMAWGRLPQTEFSTQQWYRLRMHYRTGILGRQRSRMDVEFFDGSGEGFFEAARNSKGVRALWREGYLDARTMVFCLPLWAAFPGSKLSRKDWQQRDDLLAGFERVIRNYEDLRTEGKRTQPVKSILAFTMADDPRSALQTLYSKWITPYMDNPQLYLRQLRSGAGVSRYLVNARAISEALHEEMAANRDPRVSAIPHKLDFGGRPWLIPLSAVQGTELDRIEREYKDLDDRPPLRPPVPVHVELPLLVALCERHNALM
jgi:hypothetical protein